ncbi:MEDS domain-containing protein [Actinokineospora sp. 24-640]
MRVNRIVDSARGLVPHGHLCWAFGDRAEFRARAAEYITDALSAGQWVEYVGSGDPRALWAELGAMIGGVADRGGVGVSTVEEFYETARGEPVAPEAVVASRVAAAGRAVAAGYPGVRAVVDCTAMVRTPPQRAAFARYEYLMDQRMSVLPVSALCAYDATELGAAAVAELACLHPLASAGSTLFRLYAEPGATCALAGEIDFSCAALFTRTLERTVARAPGPELVVEAGELKFVDHRGLYALSDAGRQAGAAVVLRSAPHSAAARLSTILTLPGLRVEVNR